MRHIYVALVGLIFGAGIVISGMVNPNKVLNFFDVFGTWDPSLAFVMGGGLIANFIGYRLTFARHKKPLLAEAFPSFTNSAIDMRLVGGSALFGIGWGIAGFCPGAALPALGSLNLYPVAFVAAVIFGIGCVRLLQR